MPHTALKPIDKKTRANIVLFMMRSTRQRSHIAEVLRETTSHPTAAWIFDRVKQKFPRISLGTVYRNLHILKESGIIREIKFGKNTARYDGNVEFHHHIVCQECGKLEDVMCTVSPDLIREVEAAKGYTISGHQVEFKGICPDCLQLMHKTPDP
jgi:Fe2+ or Zn2+ uptake regulation protein